MIKEEIINNIGFITVKNDSHLTIIFSMLGASIYAIYYDGSLMTLSLKNKKDFINKELYHGKTIGPVCGRILNGKIGNFQYDLNENNVTRHGGDNGLSNQLFSYEYSEKNDTISVIFTFKGFVVKYEINKKSDSFTIDYSYQGEAQPISLTNHTFFILGDDFEHLSLKVFTDYFVEYDEKTLVPLRKREIIPCLDFNKGKSLIKDISDPFLMDSRTKGYDHYLNFSKEKCLSLKSRFYQLDITTSFNGVHIYSDNYDFKEETIDHRTGLHKALAVEPQDSPLERKIYDKENNYHRFIKYCFDKIQ